MKYILLLIISMPILAMELSKSSDYTFFAVPADFLSEQVEQVQAETTQPKNTLPPKKRFHWESEESQQDSKSEEKLLVPSSPTIEKKNDDASASEKNEEASEQIASELESEKSVIGENQIEEIIISDEEPSIEQPMDLIAPTNDSNIEQDAVAQETIAANPLKCPEPTCVYVGPTKDALRSHKNRGKHKTAEQAAQEAEKAKNAKSKEQKKAEAAFKRLVKRKIAQTNDIQIETDTVDGMIFGEMNATDEMNVSLDSPGAIIEPKSLTTADLEMQQPAFESAPLNEPEEDLENENMQEEASMQFEISPIPLKCDRCGIQSRSQSRAIMHRHAHLGIKPYTCPAAEHGCKYASSYSWGPDDHAKSCPIIKKLKREKRKNSIESDTAAQPKVKNIVCPYTPCPTNFTTAHKSSLGKHIERFHSSSAKKQMVEIAQDMESEESAESDSDTIYYCIAPYCTHSSDQPIRMKVHMQLKHNLHPCPYCMEEDGRLGIFNTYTFKNEEGLLNHILEKHPKKKSRWIRPNERKS